MKRLEINFVGRGRRSPWPRRILLAVALGLTLDAALTYHKLSGQIGRSEAELARARSTPAPARPLAPEEVAAVRDTVERLALPWDRLFAALEAAASEDVALLGIEPDPKAGTVQISGDSKSYPLRSRMCST
jgi:hypothetical protein